MCGEGCWKGVTVFCLAFSLSVLAANLSAVEELTPKVCPAKLKFSVEQQMVERPIADTKKCVPLDSGLKYENLEAEKQPKEKTIQKENKKPSKSDAAKPQFYDPSKNPAEYKTLLHKEKCDEFNGRK